MRVKRPIMVLGMHRSGTSLVAEMLHRVGVEMGERLLPPAPDNPRGFFEDEEVVSLNDRILAEAGGSWDRPPSVERITRAGRSARIQADMAAYLVHRRGKVLWGFKDPRLALTFGVWLRAINVLCGGPPKIIRVERDREAVIRSLERRHGAGDWRRLCWVYERRLWRYFDRWPHDLLALDYGDILDDPELAAEELVAWLFPGLREKAAVPFGASVLSSEGLGAVAWFWNLVGRAAKLVDPALNHNGR